MPRRRDKRTDTENSDSFKEDEISNRVMHFGTVQINSHLPPDQIIDDDSSKYSIRAWSNTLLAQRLLPWTQRKLLFERAISCLPYSYKIWSMYLNQFIQYCTNRSILSKQYQELNQKFEQSLTKLPKMPRIWLMYCQSLEKQHKISKVREVYNWSFRNLPLTQHEKIWKSFTKWSMSLDNSNTALHTIPRYLKLNPDFKENYSEYLKSRNYLKLYIQTIFSILNDSGYHSKTGKSKENFELQMIDMIIEYPDKININGQTIIRNAISKGYKEAGKLWVKLSDYFIKLGQFDRARLIFDQALHQINNTKDFGIIFNAYCKFEEEMIMALKDQQINQQQNVVQSDGVEEEVNDRLKKLQNLIQRQPYLLYRINLRKNHNSIKAWLGLIYLYRKNNQINECIEICKEAIKSVKSLEAQDGKFSQIWIQYSRLIQSMGKVKECNEILFKASNINYKLMEDYLNIWIRWVQMLLEQHYFVDALKVIKNVLFRRKNQYLQVEELKIKNIDELLKTHTTLWQIYIDIEISIGNFDGIKNAYERCKQSKCLTPIMLLNFTQFLWEHTYFEECFKVFEFAVSSFKWPSLYEIWISYIQKFTKRYADDGIGVQRSRSMFQCLLKDVPKDQAEIFYFMYAQFQEQYGLYSHAIQIYDRMVNYVPNSQKFQAYNVYIFKVAKLLGITKTRAVFESALQKLNQKQILQLGVKYAELQTHLGQIERSRAIYMYISQFTDPRDDTDKLWENWETFEIEHGDKESYKEYRRIQRSVESKYAMLPTDLDKIDDKVKQGLL